MKISRKPTPPPRPAAPSRFIQPFVWTKTADQILTKANRKQLQLRSTRGRSRTPRPDGATIGGPQFDGILDLLQTGENIEPTEDKRSRVCSEVSTRRRLFTGHAIASPTPSRSIYAFGHRQR